MSISGLDLLTQGLNAQKEKKLRLRGDRSPIPSALSLISTGESADAKARLSAIAEAIGRGETSHLETMLTEQALLLEYLFSQAAVSATYATDPDQKAKLLSMALRSQNASRKTIATLHEMKHPKRATFIRNQSNTLIAGDAANGSADMDERAARIAASENPAVEAVAIEHRAKVSGRKSRK